MLRDSFYKVVTTAQQDTTSFKSIVLINKDHDIFKGHFPSVPVVPGVCMMQIIKELLEERIDKTLQLLSAGNIKFLSVINPLENPQVEIEVKYTSVEDGTFRADGSIFANNAACFKIVKAIYTSTSQVSEF